MKITIMSLSVLAVLAAGCVQEGAAPPKGAPSIAQPAPTVAQPKAATPPADVAATPSAAVPVTAPRVIVRLRDTLQRDGVIAAFRRSPLEAQTALTRLCPATSGMKVISVGAAGDLVLEGPPGANAAELAARLQADPAVAMAQADIAVKPF